MTMKADSRDTTADESAPANASDALEDILEACAKVNNDRGDDYQEQIGMPDEENMRHWSHHHTADTVDDPVFRAAMRGCDAVSFVFGLEVTWSLIQQRQQEEEERIALQELNCLQEGGDAEDKDDNEGEGEDDREVSATATKAPDAMEEEATDMDQEVVCDSPKDETAEAASCHTAVCDSDDDSTSTRGEHSAVTSEAKSFAESNSDDAAMETGQYSGTLSGLEVADADVLVPFEGKRVTTSIAGQENEQPRAASDGWACSACTFRNPRSARKCEICAAGKPRSKKRSICELTV
jgi:hypothetical protein